MCTPPSPGHASSHTCLPVHMHMHECTCTHACSRMVYHCSGSHEHMWHVCACVSSHTHTHTHSGTHTHTHREKKSLQNQLDKLQKTLEGYDAEAAAKVCSSVCGQLGMCRVGGPVIWCKHICIHGLKKTLEGCRCCLGSY